MPDYNKGDFTQQGVAGDVTTLVRLNEKRTVKLTLSADDASDNCDISGSVIDELNNETYPISNAPSGTIEITSNGTGIDVSQYALADVDVRNAYAPDDIFGPGTTLIKTLETTINLKNDTSFDTWTPTTTDTSIKVAANVGEQIDVDYANYDYWILLTADAQIARIEGASTNPYISNYYRQSLVILGRKMNSLTEYKTHTFGTSRDKINTWDKTWGIYFNTSGVENLLTSNNVGPMVTPSLTGGFVSEPDGFHIQLRTPDIHAKCSVSQFSTAAAAEIDSAKTNLVLTYYVYQTPHETSLYHTLMSDFAEMYDNVQ